MMRNNKDKVKMIAKMFPAGTKLIVDEMNDLQPIPSGSRVTVSHIDAIGQIHVEEFGIALIYGIDRFHKED